MMGFNREIFLEQPVDKDFICGICLDVLQSPTTACTSGHTYCRSCLTQTLAQSSSPKCPECRDKILASLPTSGPIQNLILRQQVRCTSRVEQKDTPAKKRHCTGNGGSKVTAAVGVGCSWTGNVCDLGEHQKSCGYADVVCTLGCERLLPRLELQKHETSECGHRVVIFPNCDKNLQSKDLIQHKLKDCPKETVSCNFCMKQMPREALGTGAPEIWCQPSVEEIMRDEGPKFWTQSASFRKESSVTGHYKTCHKTPFKCDFYDYGCWKAVKQEDLASHFQSHAPQHACLLRKKLQEVDKQIQERKRDPDWSNAITIVWDIVVDKIKVDGPLMLKSSAVALEGTNMYLKLDTNNDEDVQLSICAKDPIYPQLKIDSVSVIVNTAEGGYHKPDGAMTLRSENGSDPCCTFLLLCEKWFRAPPCVEGDFSELDSDETEVTLSDLLDRENGEVSFRCSFRVLKIPEVQVGCEP